MKPEAKRTGSKPEYPSRREFIKKFGVVAIGAGLGALAVPARANDLRGAMIAPKEDLKKDKGIFCAKTCGKEIDGQIKLLSSEDFKIRKKATAKLIAIGEAKGMDKANAAKQRQLVLAKLEPLKKAKDPEISQRAKTVIVALTPKPKPPRQDFPMHKGKIAIRR